MADNTIDTLDIQINSSTRNATKALSNLAKKLKDVDTALGTSIPVGLETMLVKLEEYQQPYRH